MNLRIAAVVPGTRPELAQIESAIVAERGHINLLYQVLFGEQQGPRFGSFVAIYGLENSIALIDCALARSA